MSHIPSYPNDTPTIDSDSIIGKIDVDWFIKIFIFFTIH